MPVHRSSAFVVVREEWEPIVKYWYFSAIVGVYHSIQRAEEIAGSSAQALRDAGAPLGYYRFTVKASTYYDA